MKNIKIENVVISGSFNQKIPLKTLVSKLKTVEYNPDRFPGAVLRFVDPKLSVLLFKSGSIVMTGLKSVKEVDDSVERIRHELSKVNINLTNEVGTKVQNIVASIKTDLKLNLDELAFTLDNTEFNPEQFPGLVYRPDDSGVSFLLFSKGNFVCVGAKSVGQIKKELDLLVGKIKEEGMG